LIKTTLATISERHNHSPWDGEQDLDSPNQNNNPNQKK
jgi:hypothetical protein